MKECVIALLVCGLSAFAFGARPFNTDDAGVVPSAGYELELGYDLWNNMGALGMGFKHGITERMDIGLGMGFNIVSEPKNSFLLSELCLKYLILQDFFAVSFATEFGLSSYAINGIFSHSFEPLEVNVNVGYITGDSSITYAGCIKCVLDRLTAGAEITGDQEVQNWLVGISYRLIEGLALDVGFTSDFNFEEEIATIGLHYEF